LTSGSTWHDSVYGSDVRIDALTLTARYAAQATTAPVLEVSGWNMPAQTIPVTAANAIESAQEAKH